MPANDCSQRRGAPLPIDQYLRRGGQRYCHRRKLPNPGTARQRAVACLELGRAVAKAYDAAPVAGTLTKVPYKYFREETWRQLDFLTRPRRSGGLGITIVISAEGHYASSHELHADLAQHRLRIRPSSGCGDPHPLLSEQDREAFRAVRHAFGYGASGGSWDPDGEEQAFWQHRQLYSPLARLALVTESRGRINALLYGNSGSCPPQKAAVLKLRFGDPQTQHLQPCDGRCLP